MALRFDQHTGIDAATGFGRFGLRIEPPTSLKVVVKVFFEVDANLRNFNVDTFFTTWANSVAEVWDNKMRFRLLATGEELTARFLLHRVGSLDACDFPVLLKAGYASSSGVKFPAPRIFGGNRMYLELAEKDNTPWFLASANNVINGNVGPNGRTRLLDNERTRVVQAAPGAAARFTVTLERAGGWHVAAASTAALNRFCQGLAATPGVVPQPPLVLHVASGADDKMRQLTTTTINYLRARGVTASIRTNFVNNGRKWHLPFHTPSPTATVEIEVASVNEMMKQWRSDYLVSAHEFGHLIGLPDEYLSYAGMQNRVIKDSQPNWNNLCGTHNPAIAPRDWNNSYNDSIMSIGRTVYKAHAVTIWHALQQATGQQWQIVLP